MLELIYTSAAKKVFQPAQLVTLLEHARTRNTARGLTGMLLYDRGSFLQVLEGEPDAVLGLFKTISEDSRHHRVIKLLETVTPERNFADWKMGFFSLENYRRGTHPAISALMDPKFSVSSFLGDHESAKARQILLAFRDGRWRTFVDT